MSNGAAGRATQRRSVLPQTYVAGRLLVIVPTLVVVLLIGAGFAGWGPGHGLYAAATRPAVHWVDGSKERHAKRHHRRHKHHHRHHKRHKERRSQ